MAQRKGRMKREERIEGQEERDMIEMLQRK
jgi:hypothetical protein